MKKLLSLVLALLMLTAMNVCFSPITAGTGLLYSNAAYAATEDVIPLLPSFEEIHERFNSQNADIFPLSDIKYDSGNYFRSNVVINGVFSGSLTYQTYDRISMQGFSLEIHYIHDSSVSEKKAWVTSQSQGNALDLTHELSKSIWFSTEILRVIWPDMSEEEAHAIILASMKALVDQDFQSLSFTYLNGLKKDGSMGPSGIFPKYKGYEFYFESGNNWIGLNLRRASLQPAIEQSGTSIDQQTSSFFLSLQSDLSKATGSNPKVIEQSIIAASIMKNAPESGAATSYVLGLTFARPETIYLVLVSELNNNNLIYLCKDTLAFEWNYINSSVFGNYIRDNLQSVMDMRTNPPHISVDILIVIDDVAVKVTEETLPIILSVF